MLYSFEKNGGVYALPYTLRLGFQIANGSEFGNVGGWTFQEMKTYMEEHPEIMIYDIDKERDELLRDFILYGGLPREDRQGTLLYSSTISMNAASKNKEGVWEFFQFLMSETYQSEPEYFPVRREQYDAYWENFLTPQIRQIPNEVTGGYIEEYEVSYVRNGEVIHCMSEEDKARMEELIERSTTFVWDMDIHGFNIIKKEADSYYAGEKSIDEVMEIIKNRMELYLAEKE